jgi:enoyl-CoA hydratase/carnithine racemase
MTECYLAALDRATADPEARAVVVTGAGRGFCAGADMTLLAGLADGGPRVANADRPPYQLEPAVPKPVIAAINGACAGLGLVRALYCDLRIAIRGAKIATAFARRGLVAEYGMSWLLPRIAGLPNALDLLTSGRTLLAEEAAELGLVDRLVDTDALAAAMAYAGELARLSSPASMRDMKRQVGRSHRDARGVGRAPGSPDAGVVRPAGPHRGGRQLSRASRPEFPAADLSSSAARMAHGTHGPWVVLSPHRWAMRGALGPLMGHA